MKTDLFLSRIEQINHILQQMETNEPGAIQLREMRSTLINQLHEKTYGKSSDETSTD